EWDDFRSCRAGVILRACWCCDSSPWSETVRQAREQGVKRGFASTSMEHRIMKATIRLLFAVMMLAGLGMFSAAPVAAQQGGPPPGTLPAHESRFSSGELVNAGHRFFGTVSRGLAQIVEKAVS